MRILIAGASISGLVLAYWLTRYGFEITVIECVPALRKTGGHTVDLFRPSMEISAKIGVLSRIKALTTGTNAATIYRENIHQPVRIDITKAIDAVADQYMEILYNDFNKAYYAAGRDHVDYLFDNSTAAISPTTK
nr:FAD-dependent monooxygenase [Mycobacterium uberis]